MNQNKNKIMGILSAKKMTPTIERKAQLVHIIFDTDMGNDIDDALA